MQTDQPEQAVGHDAQQLPGVLLLDLSMPKVSGLEILASMRDDPVLRHVPVIVLTSSTDPQVKLKALALGAMDFLSSRWTPASWACASATRWLPAPTANTWGSTTTLTGLPNKQRYA